MEVSTPSQRMTGQSRPAAATSILHCVDLGGVGGVERYFLGYIESTLKNQRIAQGIFLTGSAGVDSHFHAQLDNILSNGVNLYRKKYVGKIKIPRRPPQLRRIWGSKVASRYSPGIALFWNQLKHYELLRSVKAGGLAPVYWERGAGWYSDFDDWRVRATLRDVDAALANSRAGAEILKFRGYDKPVSICQNGVRADIFRHKPAPRELPEDRPLRLGVAARLVPKKGVALALHVVHLARVKGFEVELDIAGDGPDRQALRALAASLGISAHVRFHGVIGDMIGFYSEIDCLLHPVLREPCSNTLAEAQYCGCPVVATNVDGVPEVVAPNGGVLVAAELDERGYTQLGVSADDQPPFVYDPVQRCVRPPLAPCPEALLQGVESIISSADRYAEVSRDAIAWTSRELDPNIKYAQALEALHRIACARGVV